VQYTIFLHIIQYVHYNAQVFGVILLKNLNSVISDNLKRIRRKKNLSLDKVSQLTSISKSMLGQIERKETNPTITTVWKIANGLKISFTSLIKEKVNEVQIISKDHIQPLINRDNGYRLYPVFLYDENTGFEIYTVELEPGSILEADGHVGGVREYITVFQGRLSVQVEDKEYQLARGNAIKFDASKPHVYKNTSKDITILNMTIYYSDKY